MMPPTGMPPTGLYGAAPTAVATMGAPVAEYRGDVMRPLLQGPALLPWNQVAGERIFNGALMIDQQGAPGSMSAPLAQLPNLRAHMALIDAIRAGQV